MTSRAAMQWWANLSSKLDTRYHISFIQMDLDTYLSQISSRLQISNLYGPIHKKNFKSRNFKLTEILSISNTSLSIYRFYKNKNNHFHFMMKSGVYTPQYARCKCIQHRLGLIFNLACIAVCDSSQIWNRIATNFKSSLLIAKWNRRDSVAI